MNRTEQSWAQQNRT